MQKIPIREILCWGNGLALLHLLCSVIAWEQHRSQRMGVGCVAWPQNECCSGSKGMAAGGCQTSMFLTVGSLEGRAEQGISVSATVTYCLAKLEYFPKIYC